MRHARGEMDRAGTATDSRRGAASPGFQADKVVAPIGVERITTYKNPEGEQAGSGTTAHLHRLNIKMRKRPTGHRDIAGSILVGRLGHCGSREQDGDKNALRFHTNAKVYHTAGGGGKLREAHL